jgi:signal transduction histidine kinase
MRPVRFALLAAVPLILVLALTSEDVFRLGNQLTVPVLAFGLVLVGVMLVLGLRDLRAAENRTDLALDRAEAAEATQRARADELARILTASEGLVLVGDGPIDYLAMLRALTPDGATSFLIRIEGEGEGESLVVAAHGPLAPWFVGRRWPAGRTFGATPSSLVSYSASGRVVGTAVPMGHIDEQHTDIQAALGVRLVDHNGRSLGWLHLLDPAAERILDPAFISLAQLVGNQVGVAMENHALVARVRNQLTEVQRVQQQLLQASKLGAVGELAAAVAHEVNNPLTGILGFSELLMAECPPGDPHHEEATVIHTEAVRARSIIRALLEFARPRPPQRTPTDLNQLARTTLELVRFRCEEAGIFIVEDFADLPSLELDPDAFSQVILNLLNNAIDAMPQGGELRIGTGREGDRVHLLVADSGMGMNEETRRRVFTPFFSTRAGAGGGTGLGLSVSLQIVEGHGGTIEVESEPGRGAIFTIRLPISWPAFDGAVVVPGMQAATAETPAAEEGADASASAASAKPAASGQEAA